MTRPWRQYAVLVFLLFCAVSYESANLTFVYHVMRHPARFPAAPFGLMTATRTIGSGPLYKDEILSINGHPFTADRQLDDAVYNAHPGDKLDLVLSEPSGRAVEKFVEVPSQAGQFGSASQIALNICLEFVIPLVCLTLGFTVAFIRPRDKNAWLLLLLLVAFSSLVGRAEWNAGYQAATFFWLAFGSATWAIWMMLFAIYFPSRFEPDRRQPWLKYLIIMPGAVIELIFWGVVWLWTHNLNAALQWRNVFVFDYFAHITFQILTVGVFFALLAWKSRKAPSPDDRRRLRILRAGASVALGPMFLILLDSLIRRVDLFTGVPWPLEVTALCLMALFPITLAYVIVVERAMDLSIVLRQSLQYAVARGIVTVLRVAVIVLLVNLLIRRTAGSPAWITVGIGFVGMFVFRHQRVAQRASTWVDRKFFREAYDADTVLSELAVEAGRYVEIDPLLETVARRISGTLHVPDIVILVRDGDVYRTRFSTRLGEPMDIAAGSHLLTAPGAQDAPLEVYFDKPQPWIRSLTAEEIQTLDYMRSELLLALRGRGSDDGRIIGIMSLGPKKSGVPYSKTDIRLLQTIAVQMGWALENSRLAASLADEAAHREVMHRELEIAREVQERLFPQTFPEIPGVDCYGYCRPARGVGGDYYDFIALPDGRLGLAIGDVSGKGIAAALLMASLQASLRGQTMSGVRDLAELMRNMNKLIFETSQSNRYATFFYGEFDPKTKQLAFVNAGHNPPVILRGYEVTRLEASGPVVGLLPSVAYTMEVCPMQTGDIFIGYTDGISEAMNERDEEWEEERFIAAARARKDCAAPEMIAGIFRGADAFTGAAKQYDDMTLLVMKLQA